jgi:mannose-1-phosphate guanylyltransferase
MDLTPGRTSSPVVTRRADETRTSGHLWALLLAAGDGNRVRSLIHTADGAPAPKQFCVLHGRQSLLRRTIERAAALVPRRRIVTVVAERHRRWWEKELSVCPMENVVVQPHNRGTAAGILLPLLRIVQQDRLATIIVLPSDHHVAREELLSQSIEEAVQAVRMDQSRVVLLGMTARECDTEYGWILPSGGSRPVGAVTAFVEKPDSTRARFLLRSGALLNSLIFVATGRTLLQLYDHATPRLVGELVAWRDEAAGRSTALETLYRTLPSYDFSREVLEPSCDFLSVLRAPDCGWTDVGTPERLACLCGRRAEKADPDTGAASGA